MLNIIIKETKEFLREKTNLFFFLMFPVMLVFLLGNLLSSMDNAEEAIGEIKLHYITETENVFHKMMIQGFVNAIADDQNITFQETKNISASKAMAARDEITAVVKFTGDPLAIKIYEGTNHIKNRTVSAIMNGFVQTYKSVSTIRKTSSDYQMLEMAMKERYIKQKDLGVNRTMIDYYAVTMLAMICFMSTLVGSMVFLGERQNRTINRLLIAPRSKILLFFSKILGLMPQIILQIGIIMIVSVVVFNAHYAVTLGDNLYLFLMFFIVTLALISIGAVIGLFTRMNPMSFLMPVLWVMMFVSGTYSKEIYIKGFTEAMPIHQVQKAAFDLTVFGRYERANSVILWCILITVIMLSIGAYIFSRKEEER